MAYRPAMEMDHTEAIKQAVMAELGVAFVSLYTVQGERARAGYTRSAWAACRSIVIST